MSKEIRHDLYTQAEYAKLVGRTRSWVCLQVKDGKLKTLTVKGAILVKI